MGRSKPSFFISLIAYLLSAKYVLGSIAILICVCAGFIAFGGYIVDQHVYHSYPGALYLSWVTALTIGYGDILPYGYLSKIFAVLVGLLGILFTGIIVAASINALRDSR